MSRKRQFSKYLNDLFSTGRLKELTRSVWDDMNVIIPEWPHKDGDADLSIRVGVVPPPFKGMEPLRVMKLRLMQKFNQGDSADYVESEIFSEMLLEETCKRGLPLDKMLEDEIRETMRLELLELKDYFFKTINGERFKNQN